jgi:hypothetical protein
VAVENNVIHKHLSIKIHINILQIIEGDALDTIPVSRKEIAKICLLLAMKNILKLMLVFFHYISTKLYLCEGSKE